MTSPSSPRRDTDDDRFVSNGAADSVDAARIRDEFAHWLQRHIGVDEVRWFDAVLAVNEALANAAEFAYGGGEGTVGVLAVGDRVRRCLTVTVSDRGSWHESSPLDRQPSRGRGISLMRNLADSVVIATSGRGTSVLLRFDGLFPGRPAIAGAF